MKSPDGVGLHGSFIRGGFSDHMDTFHMETFDCDNDLDEDKRGNKIEEEDTDNDDAVTQRNPRMPDDQNRDEVE